MGDVTVGHDALAEEFSTHRSHLLGVAYRLTSTLADAEDAVQESWLRLSTLDDHKRAEIRDLRAWLTTIVGRIALDKLRCAAFRRERYVGPWLPEPILTPLGTAPSEDPLEVVVRDDGVRMAAMVVLDRLSPEQRVAFVLHDAFSVPFAEIAELLGCTVDTARQYASRARRAVADADPPPRVSLDEQRALVERFLVALANGDLKEVVSLLHPDITLIGDADGRARTARRVMHGQERIARFSLGLVRQYGLDRLAAGQFMLANGDLAMVLPDVPGDEDHWDLARRVQVLAVRDGRICGIYDIVNPDKLTRLPV